MSRILRRPELGRTTLTWQLLLERVSRPVAHTLERLVGLHGQAPRVPHLALWDQIADYEPAELDGDSARLTRGIQL